MTETAEEQPDPATLPRFNRVPSDGRAAEQYPEPFPPDEPAPTTTPAPAKLIQP